MVLFILYILLAQIFSDIHCFVQPTNSCSIAIQQFLSDSYPEFDGIRKSLSLEVDSRRFEKDCGTSEILIELWRVISKHKIERPDSFGSKEYFHRDQHCENPNPDLLAKHGAALKVETVGRDETDVAVFHHVVEQEYMIRICPCLMSHCTCETVSPGSQVCSQIFQVENPEDDQVFAWCRGLESSPQPKIDSPIIQHCPAQLKITGVIPSCTTVQDYDQVEVILQAFHGQPTTCKQKKLEELIKSTALDKIVKLNSINKTHGAFDVDIENITHNVYYCVRVELVNHPYCNSGSDGSLDRQNKICRPALWNEPIYISAHSCGPPPNCPDTAANLPLITGASLAAALVLAIGLVLIHRILCRREPPPVDKSVSDRLLQPTTVSHYPDVFFLYFCDSSEFVTVNKLVVRWISGLGHRVIDLSDEMLQEELISSPETWISDRLEDPNTKVVLVNSDSPNECLSVDVEENSVPCDMKDNMDALRVFSLRHIHQRLATNYRRLAIIQYRQDQAKSLVSLVPHTRHILPDHLPELQAWLAETHGWDDNDNMESTREQTLRDLKAAVQKYTSNYK